MVFADMVEAETINSFLGITDGKYDEIIDAAIPTYLFLIKKLTNIDYDELDEDSQNFMLGVIAVGLGCHIMKVDPSFGLKYQNWAVGNAKKSYFRRYASDFENWCDMYEDLINDATNFFSTSTAIYGERPGLSDTLTID